MSKRDWALIISGIVGSEAGKRLLKRHPTLGAALGAIAASVGTDRLLKERSSNTAHNATVFRERIEALRSKPEFRTGDPDAEAFFEEILDEKTPADLLAGFVTGDTPNWMKSFEADEAQKSLARQMGETMAFSEFIKRVVRVRADHRYSEFWRSWETYDTEKRKKIILGSVYDNTDSSVVPESQAMFKYFAERLDEQEGIDRLTSPDLSIYEHFFRRIKFMYEPQTRGFYEIHRVLVGSIDFRISAERKSK